MLQRFFRSFFVLVTVLVTLSCVSTPKPVFSAQDIISLTPQEEEYISSHKTVKVGYVPDRIPVSFQNSDGEIDGISKYILDRVSEICGIDFEYQALPTKNVTYDYLLGENFDLVTSVEYNEQNKKANGILISDYYFSSRKVIVARENREFKYDANATVAVSTGSQTLKKVLASMFPHFTLKDYDTISDCFDAVNSGDADYLIQNQYVVEYWLSRPKYEKLKVIPVMGLDDQLCFSAVVALNGGTEGTSSEDGQTLINILDKSIAGLTEDEIGSYTIQGVMENQYEYRLSDFLNRYRYSVSIFVVLMIVIIILVIVLTQQKIRIAESKADARAEGRFLSTMSHEIRTPLNGLMGLNYLMSQKLDDVGKISGYLRQSSVTAKYLLSLVNDMLDSSKLQEDKLELVFAPVDLKLLFETINSIEHGAMSEKNLNHTFSADLTYPCVMGDEVRIQQVVLNLLDNARKFTQKGGKVDLSVTQKMTKKGSVLTSVVVSDTGKGMSEEFQKHIFDVFAQESETVSKGNQGTGLGLSISHKLALLMGGDLTFTSQKGVGSEFVFTFLGEVAQLPENNAEEQESDTKRLSKILVAEDNELNAEIILEMLKSFGFETEIAENGKIALEIFKNSEPGTFGVVLMDLMMPEMDGFECAKAIRSLPRKDAKTVRIFACTANSLSEEKDRAFESGMDDFITKPVDINYLVKKLNETEQ